VPDLVGQFREEKTEPARTIMMPPAPMGAAGGPPGAMFASQGYEPELARAPMPKSRARISRSSAKKEGYAGGAPQAGFGDDAGASPELRAAPELLAYSSLRLPQPTDPRRGGLVRVDDSELYLDLLAHLHVHVDIDVFTAVRRAVDRARQIVRQPLPLRHVAPRDEDGFDYAYRAESPLDVPADGAFHALPLSQHQAAARPRYVVVPRYVKKRRAFSPRALNNASHEIARYFSCVRYCICRSCRSGQCLFRDRWRRC
jgi:hypothetical protein